MNSIALQTDAHAQPCVHLVDDDESFRETLAYGLQSRGWMTRCFASGEEFLAAWTWGMQGVLVLDLQFKPVGSLQGDQVFQRLLQLRCPMPILFLTGPFENDVLKCEQLVSQRGDVRYLPKRVEPEARSLAIASSLARAPTRLARASNDRRLLQVVLDDLSGAEREVMSEVLLGKTSKEIARYLGKDHGVVDLQRASGLGKVADANGSWELLAHLMSPLMSRLGAHSLPHLAAIELGWRLRLLTRPQIATLMKALSCPRWPVELAKELRQDLPPILTLLQAPHIKRVRAWLRWAHKEPWATIEPLLPGDELAPLREWLKGPHAQFSEENDPQLPS